MGDTGSMLVGVICSILAISFIELNKTGVDPQYRISAPPAIAVSVLFIPLFDTIRVFTLRLIRGVSPFIADRQHMHHLLLDLGLTHLQVTSILIMLNTIIIIIAFNLQFLGNITLVWIILCIGILFTLSLGFLKKRSWRANRLSQ